MEWKEPRPRPEPQPGTKRTQSSTVLLLLLLLAAFAGLSTAGPPKLARPPLLSGQPFIIFWGVPDSSCSDRLDPRTFGMERGSRVAVFYEDTLGNYPYFIDKDTAVNGGLPQHTRLNNHLQKIQQDLDAALPTPRFLGLGVLRWTEWVPQWSRNRERRDMYREASRNLMKTFFPGWTPEEVEKWSQMDFEAAAQSVITETLREVRWLRPKALWGISPYPSCYNGDATQTSLANYTGRCPASEMALNDELLWLWKRSSAVYPLLSMEKVQGGTSGVKRYLNAQIKEALRVSSLTGTEFDLPVLPLIKSIYISTSTFLSQDDLVSALGESAAMGTAGVVIWEKSEPKSQRECQDLAEFVSKVLGPYSLNVTTATRLCSASLCQGRGRCVRQNAESSAYLHLPPPPAAPEKGADQLEAKTGELDPVEIWKRDFQCQWYKSTDGDVSDQLPPRDGAPARGAAEESPGNVLGTTVTSATKRASVSWSRGSSPSDTGSSPSDTGSSPSDTGSSPSDTGSSPSDTGSSPSDTGSSPSDTGSSPSDTGSSPSDTGSPMPSLDIPAGGGGTNSPNVRDVCVLLLLVAGSLCLVS